MRRSALLAVLAVVLLAACGSSGPHSSSNAAVASLSVTVPGWGHGFACTDPAHLGRSPHVTWSPGPAGTTGYAITIIDPAANDFVHWVLLGLPPSVTSLDAGISPGGRRLPAGARELDNGFGKPGYGGPCPPAGTTHPYVLTVWAVKDHPGSIAEIRRDALASGTVTASYSR